MPAVRGLEPRLAEAISAALAASFGHAGRPVPGLRSAEPLSGGSLNRAFRLDTSAGPFFAKWNADAPADFFRREREGLEALAAARSPLRIPAVIAGGTAPGALPAQVPAPPGQASEAGRVLILEWLEPARAGDSKVWERLGLGLAALHRATAPAFGFHSDNYCGLTPQENAWTPDWPAFHAGRRLGALLTRLEKSGRLGAGEAGIHQALIARLPALLDHRPVPSLLHGDLWSGNALESAEGPALVDPAVYYGDREADLAMMLLFGGFPSIVLSSYQESWPLSAGWRERIPLYQLYHILNHQLLFGGGYGEQAIRLASRYL
jgi:fructosamine-3-kinase